MLMFFEKILALLKKSIILLSSDLIVLFLLQGESRVVYRLALWLL